MTQYIKAPFNFVPLNEKVFFPDWADQISHDIPFEDGESGTIEIELTAMTPIFVRNGHTRLDAEAKNDEYTSFSKDADGNYFIPATSVKGMIRNVLEIISFGKMNQISNDRFGFRDLHNAAQYLRTFQNEKLPVRCGYLRKITENEVEISDHGVPFRISHDELDVKFGSGLRRFCQNKANLEHDKDRTSKKKYDLLGNINLEATFIQDDSLKTFNKDPRLFVRFKNEGNLKGRIILTGQPSVREKKFDYKKGKESWTGKFYEFVFRSTENTVTEILPIQNDYDLRFKDFLFIHKDSLDWSNFRKKQFDNREPIPIFFIKDSNGKVLHFGLSYLYKLPYNKRVKDCLTTEHKKKDADLADLVFGNQDLGIKGRIQFSNAKLENGQIGIKVEPLMGSPKASYYPIYLKQNGFNGKISGNDYQTFSSSSPVLKGWKRYPVHNELSTIPIADNKQEKNVSPFIPLSAGSRFSLKIHFHNLKQEEIGALLLAINLNHSNGFHSLGFAKAFGYGKLKINLKHFSVNKDESAYETVFKKLISSYIPNWDKGIEELLLMTKEQNIDNKLQYMQLSDFADAKSDKKSKGKLYLPVYSEYIKEPSKDNYPSGNTLIAEKLGRPIIKKAINPIRTEDDNYIESENFIQVKKTIQPDSEWLKAKIIGNKKVRIDGFDYDISLVIPMDKQNISLKINELIWVKEKQKTKDGKLNQVEFMSVT